MKDVLLVLIGWFCLVFFGTLLTVLGFRLALLVVSNVMGVCT